MNTELVINNDDIEYAAFEGFDLQDKAFFHTYTSKHRKNRARANEARRLIEEYWIDMELFYRAIPDDR